MESQVESQQIQVVSTMNSRVASLVPSHEAAPPEKMEIDLCPRTDRDPLAQNQSHEPAPPEMETVLL